MLERRRIATFLLGVALTLGVVAGPAAPRAAAASLRLCGVVAVYVPPTLLGTGLLTVGVVPLVVAQNTKLPASVAVGADLCFDLTTNLLGLVTGAVVTLNAATPLGVCGEITDLAPPIATADGRLTVAGVPRTIAAGTVVDPRLRTGSFARLDLTIDGLGRVAGIEADTVATTLAGACGGLPLPLPLPSIAFPSVSPALTGPITPPGPSAPPSFRPPAAATPTPAATPRATPSTTEASPSAAASTSGSPSAVPSRPPSPSPSPAATPSASAAPVASASARPAALVPEASAAASGAAAAVVDGLDDVVPDAASLSRAASLVSLNAIPILVIGLGVIAIGWAGAIRRRFRA